MAYETASASSCFCKSLVVSHRPRTITPARRLRFATDTNGLPSTKIKSARIPTEIVPNSFVAPKNSAASLVAALIA
ncbi:MAG TPA: hypothetical protein VK308_10900 [Pyrinomonadaceae bacterium]|nr:hypothetical protein [Pyrinomonadaceae bacterium]